jgi:enamine deaminase RidA (YjgF/YER057c/UK114 family)
MPLDSRIVGSVTGYGAEVDVNNNAKVNMPTAVAQAGFASLAAESDAGTVTGAREVRKALITSDTRLLAGIPSLIVSKTFPGTAVNTGYWHQIATTQTVGVASGLLTLNSGNVTTLSTGSGNQSAQPVPINMGGATVIETDGYPTNTPLSNNVTEWGAFNYTTFNGAITDGALFRFNAVGEFRCVLVTNSIEAQSGVLSAATLAPINSIKNYFIRISDEGAEFLIDGVRVANLMRPSTAGSSLINTALYISQRTYTSATAPASASQFKVGHVASWLEEETPARHYTLSMTGQGGHSSYTQDGTTAGITALYTNNTAPTAAVPTNTTAALGSGLGGHFIATATAAVNTDLIISSYQNPANGAAVTGKTLYLRGVWLETYVQTVLVGGGQNIVWYLSIGSTAVSEATTETATTKIRRVIPLGVQTVAAAAAALTQAIRIQVLLTDVPVFPGEFVKVCCRYVGTAATSGAYGHLIGFDGFNE